MLEKEVIETVAKGVLKMVEKGGKADSNLVLKIREMEDLKQAEQLPQYIQKVIKSLVEQRKKQNDLGYVLVLKCNEMWSYDILEEIFNNNSIGSFDFQFLDVIAIRDDRVFVTRADFDDFNEECDYEPKWDDSEIYYSGLLKFTNEYSISVIISKTSTSCSFGHWGRIEREEELWSLDWYVEEDEDEDDVENEDED